MPSLHSINSQRFDAVSLLIDKFMFDMGYVIPVEGFLSQDLAVIENAFNAIRDQHQTLENFNDSLNDELGSCEERVEALEAELKTLRPVEE